MERLFPALRWWPALVVFCAPAAGGCGESKRFFDLHMANDPKAQAKARWEAVRGSVKLQLAEEHLKSGRLVEAERSLEEALALCPNDAKAFVVATRLRLEQGRLAEAREAITVAAALSDNDPEIPYFAGLVAQRYGDLESACEYFSAASRTSPHVATYVLSQAETLVNLDRPVEALELLQSRMNDFDRDVAMRMLAARISRILGLRGPAVAYCREALRISNESPLLSAELGMMLVWAEQFHDAIAVLAPLVERKGAARGSEKDPGEKPAASAARALARAYLETDQGVKAIEVLRSVLEANPEDTVAWSLCARAALMVGRLETLDEALSKIEAQGAATAETRMMTGFAALRRGDFVRARNEAAGALILDARLTLAHYLAGQAAEAMGELDAARASYEAVLEIDPDSTIARRRIDGLDGSSETAPPAVSPADDAGSVKSNLHHVIGSACPPEEAVP
ncbi:MAG TPA: tetratricopeptide repeat protein [Phycisphaerae bacterium]|nr:tetratricopeptide repeat protein [Phycisphaerae bacterium]